MFDDRFDVEIREMTRAMQELSETGFYTLITTGESFRPSREATRAFWDQKMDDY